MITLTVTLAVLAVSALVMVALGKREASFHFTVGGSR